MNWKYNSLFVLLLGAFAWGGYAFLEVESSARSAGSVIAYPSVSGSRSFGSGAAVSDDVLVPMTGSDAAHRLFHAGGAAVSAAASSPSRATSGASASGTVLSASGATSGAGASGMYLTSGSAVRSYGGGSDQGGAASAYGAAASAVSASSASSYSSAGVSMPSFAVNRSYASGSAYASGSTYASALQTNGYTSADDALAVRSGMPRRAPGTIESEFYKWLESNLWGYGNGSQALSEADIQALWNALSTDPNTHMPDGMTFEAFYSWFMSKQSDENFLWKLPVGDALPILLLLSTLWGLHIYRRQTKNSYHKNTEKDIIA